MGSDKREVRMQRSHLIASNLGKYIPATHAIEAIGFNRGIVGGVSNLLAFPPSEAVAWESRRRQTPSPP